MEVEQPGSLEAVLDSAGKSSVSTHALPQRRSCIVRIAQSRQRRVLFERKRVKQSVCLVLRTSARLQVAQPRAERQFALVLPCVGAAGFQLHFWCLGLFVSLLSGLKIKTTRYTPEQADSESCTNTIAKYDHSQCTLENKVSQSGSVWPEELPLTISPLVAGPSPWCRS